MDENMMKYVLICGTLLAFFSIMSSGSKDKRTDGVFESAMEKMDSGRPLSAAEQQRVSDIINWCDSCNGPVRSCSH
jgi:hypothetical protein